MKKININFYFSETLTNTCEHKFKSFAIEQKQFNKLILNRWSIVQLVIYNINETIDMAMNLPTHISQQITNIIVNNVKKTLILAHKIFHLQSNEHKNSKKMWYCEVCKKNINFNTKSSHIKSVAHIENEVISRINDNLTDKTYT